MEFLERRWPQISHLSPKPPPLSWPLVENHGGQAFLSYRKSNLGFVDLGGERRLSLKTHSKLHARCKDLERKQRIYTACELAIFGSPRQPTCRYVSFQVS